MSMEFFWLFVVEQFCRLSFDENIENYISQKLFFFFVAGTMCYIEYRQPSFNSIFSFGYSVYRMTCAHRVLSLSKILIRTHRRAHRYCRRRSIFRVRVPYGRVCAETRASVYAIAALNDRFVYFVATDCICYRMSSVWLCVCVCARSVCECMEERSDGKS